MLYVWALDPSCTCCHFITFLQEMFCNFSCFCRTSSCPLITPDHPLLSLWFFQAWTLVVWAATSMTRSPVQWPSLEPFVPLILIPLLTISHSITCSPFLFSTCAFTPETTSLPRQIPFVFSSDPLDLATCGMISNRFDNCFKHTPSKLFQPVYTFIHVCKVIMSPQKNMKVLHFNFVNWNRCDWSEDVCCEMKREKDEMDLILRCGKVCFTLTARGFHTSRGCCTHRCCSEARCH